MADTSINDDRTSLLIWQLSNYWQSEIRFGLKKSNLSFNEYLIMEAIFKLSTINENISQTQISKTVYVDKSVISIKISQLEKKGMIKKIKPVDKRSDRIILTINGKAIIEQFIINTEKIENKLFGKLDNEIFNFTNSLKLLLGKKIRVKVKSNDQ